MKILHTSDWHAGKAWKGQSRLDELAAVLDDLASVVERERVDLVLMTGDIFDTARRMALLGFQPLPMTGNYYKDLQARFDLDPDTLRDMLALNILYDEDANGAFFQFYSQPFAGGLFFEIVQRVNGYDGYGAPNAPFRIAAQKRLLRPKGMPRL